MKRKPKAEHEQEVWELFPSFIHSHVFQLAGGQGLSVPVVKVHSGLSLSELLANRLFGLGELTSRRRHWCCVCANIVVEWWTHQHTVWRTSTSQLYNHTALGVKWKKIIYGSLLLWTEKPPCSLEPATQTRKHRKIDGDHRASCFLQGSCSIVMQSGR